MHFCYYFTLIQGNLFNSPLLCLLSPSAAFLVFSILTKLYSIYKCCIFYKKHVSFGKRPVFLPWGDLTISLLLGIISNPVCFEGWLPSARHLKSHRRRPGSCPPSAGCRPRALPGEEETFPLWQPQLRAMLPARPSRGGSAGPPLLTQLPAGANPRGPGAFKRGTRWREPRSLRSESGAWGGTAVKWGKGPGLPRGPGVRFPRASRGRAVLRAAELRCRYPQVPSLSRCFLLAFP